MHLRLEIDIMASQWVAIVRQAGDLDSQAWGHKENHRSIHNLEVLIARSEWIKRVLPETGYGTVYLLELPRIPLDRCKAIEPAVDALKKAHRLLADGHFQDAVRDCRLALEPFFELKEVAIGGGKVKDIPTLKSSWETRLGKATYDWLNASLSAIKAPGNAATHSTKAHFDETAAQMLLTVTTALVAYAAQALTEPMKKEQQ